MSVRGLHLAFPGGADLFRGLTFDLCGGRTYALLGPSGSGKSTLLSVIAGWVEPDSGEVVRDEVRRTSWVFQNPHGVARRTALDHVSLPLLAAGSSRAAADIRATELLDMFDLGHLAEQPFSSLSGGEAQRLMLARGLAADPDLLLLDEPTAQLDQQSAATVLAVIGNLSAFGAIGVVATHDPLARQSCDHTIELSGR